MAERTTSMRLHESISSILVIRLKALGDIVLSMPLLNSFRRTFPESRIDFLCLKGYGEAVQGNPDIDRVIEFEKGISSQAGVMLELRRRRYDLVLDLISSPRSAVITLFTGADLRVGMDVGRHNFCYHKVLPRTIERNGERVILYTMDGNREIARILNLEPDRLAAPENRYQTGFPPSERGSGWAGEFLAPAGPEAEGFIGVVPGAKYSAKSWPKEKFVEFISLLTERTGYLPVLIWGPGEEDIADYIVERSEETLKPPLIGISKLGALIGKMDCVVGVDSGPKHLAVLQGVPTVTLFGPTDPRVWDPCSGIHRVIRRDLDCSPCGLTECSYAECMHGIGADELFEETLKLLRVIRQGRLN
ncbi:MAG: glycosyltransferase family 9 protein [Candidatus Krumholzibacteriota bacterium]